MRSARSIVKVSRGEPAILFHVGPYMFAIAASAVDEIRESSGTKALASAGMWRKPAKVAQIVERGSRTFLVVDANVHLHMLPTHHERLLMLHSGRGEYGVAVAVDQIDRMAEIERITALPLAFTGEERTWYRGLTLVDGVVVPVVNHESFLNKVEMQVLVASVERERTAAEV